MLQHKPKAKAKHVDVGSGGALYIMFENHVRS